MVYCADEELLDSGMTDEDMGGAEINVRTIFEMDHPQLLPIYVEAFAIFNHGFPRTSGTIPGQMRFDNMQTILRQFCNYLT